MLRQRTVVLTLVVSVVLLAGSPALADQVFMSTSPDRSNPIPLDGRTIDGEVFIFFVPDAALPGVREVEYFIDGTLVGKSKKSPYDMVGDGKAFDTRAELADGSHALEVAIAQQDGVQRSAVASFLVDNAGAPIPPSAGLQVIRATADVVASTLTLEGSNLGPVSGATQDLRVALDLVPVTVTGYTNDFITAALPPGISPGDHLVNVSRDGVLAPGLVDEDHAELLLTIGAVGPRGEPGPPGPMGLPGPQGPQGEPGEGDGHSLDAADGSVIDALFVDNAGRVGIGTTTPATALEVDGGLITRIPAVPGGRTTTDPSGFGVGIMSGVNRVVTLVGEPTIRFLRTDDDYANLGIRGLSIGSAYGFPTVEPPLYGMIVEGRVGIGTSSPAYPLHMGSGAHVTAGGVWTNASSRKLKMGIRDLSETDALDALIGLNPVTFAYKADPTETYVGFIAEDVPDIVATNDREGLAAMDIAAILTRVVQLQQERIEALERRLAALEQ